MVPSFDPALELVYFGTSVTAPSPKYMLAGNDARYLYHNSTLALRPRDGELVWYYQHMVDHWDLDHAFERILVDVAVAPAAAEVPFKLTGGLHHAARGTYDVGGVPEENHGILNVLLATASALEGAPREEVTARLAIHDAEALAGDVKR